MQLSILYVIGLAIQGWPFLMWSIIAKNQDISIANINIINFIPDNAFIISSVLANCHVQSIKIPSVTGFF